MNKLNDIENFILFCLESYRKKTNKSGKEALIDFENYDVFSFIEKGFEVLHTQSMNYIIDEIISFIENKK
jgi:hypothetical protein